MSIELVQRLEHWKRRFDPAGARRLEHLLAIIARRRFGDAPTLIRLHETLLFLRAYPPSEKVALLADAVLFSFGDRISPDADPDPFEEPEVSGIAGTSLTAVFSYEVARRLAALHPRGVEVGWDRYDEVDRLGPVVGKLLPMLNEDWPVEAHTPFQQWIAAAHSHRSSDLQWLLENVTGADAFDSLQLPITWRMGRSSSSRSSLRLPLRSLYLHREPLLQRGDVSLDRELTGPPLPVKRLPKAEAR